MNQMVSTQAILFIASIEIGILMGVLFDLLRVFRILLKHPNFLVQIEDMLFWLVCSLFGFYRLYICNYAEIRPYIFLGILLGAILYFSTVSVIFIKTAKVVIQYIKSLIVRVVKWVVVPVKAVIKTVLRWCRIPIQYIFKKWQHFCYLNKLRYKQYKRRQYEVKSDKKVARYLREKKS